MKNNSLEGIFRQKLEDLRVEPSAQARDLVYQKIRKRGRIVLLRRLSIAAGIALVFSAGYFYLGPAGRQDDMVYEKSPSAGSGAISEIPGSVDEHPAAISENQAEAREKITSGATEAENAEIMQEELIPGNQQPAIAEVIPVQEKGHVETREANTDGEIPAKTPDREPAALALDNKMEKPGSGSVAVEPIATAVPAAPEDFPALTVPLAESNTAQQTPESNVQETAKPVKITIEYIASGSGKTRGNANRNAVRELYSKVHPEAVIGDLRTLKDQLFALEFINKNTGENQAEK